MKKTILASAILLVAGAANAAEVYNNEGATVTLGGSFRGHAVVNDSDNVSFQDAGSRFDVKAAKELDNGLKAFGAAEIKYTDIEDAVKNDDRASGLYLNQAYVGLAHDVYGSVAVGQQLGLDDDLYYHDFSYVASNVGSNDATEQLKYANSFGAATVVASVMNQDAFAIGGVYEVAGLTVGADYIYDDNKNADTATYLLSAQYAIDALTVAATYGSTEVANVDNAFYGVGAKYALGQAGVYAMYDSAEAGTKTATAIVVGADYELAEGVIAYAEFASKDADKPGESADEIAYIGGRFYF